MKTLSPEQPAPDTPTLREEKANLRRVMQARREALSETERAAASRAICRQLLSLPLFAEGQSELPGAVAVYLATSDEADVDEAARVLLARGASLLAPCLEPNASAPAFRRLNCLSDVHSGVFGIRSPVALSASVSSCESDEVQVDDIAVVLVPGLAFDRSGRRLGRGGGWYDRVLSHMKQRAVPIIGVCFECQLVPDVPCEPHDQRVSIIVTEAQTIEIDL